MTAPGITGATLWTAAVDKKGQVIAAGDVQPNAAAKGSLLIVANSKDGKILRTTLASPLDQASYQAVLPEEDGGIMAAGNITEAARNKVFLERIDPAGKRVWRRSYLGLRNFDVSLSNAGLGRWSGGYVLGTTGSAKYAFSILIRTDSSGHDSCATAGKCAAAKPVLCDDGKPCTADWCDAKLGCQHKVIAGCSL